MRGVLYKVLTGSLIAGAKAEAERCKARLEKKPAAAHPTHTNDRGE